jgi:hypothetical protein
MTMTTETETSIDLSIDISSKTHRILQNALATGRTSFADLPELEQEDLVIQGHLFEIREELESIAGLPYRTELGERYMELTKTWIEIDPHGLLAFLDEVAQDETRQ